MVDDRRDVRFFRKISTAVSNLAGYERCMRRCDHLRSCREWSRFTSVYLRAPLAPQLQRARFRSAAHSDDPQRRAFRPAATPTMPVEDPPRRLFFPRPRRIRSPRVHRSNRREFPRDPARCTAKVDRKGRSSALICAMARARALANVRLGGNWKKRDFPRPSSSAINRARKTSCQLPQPPESKTSRCSFGDPAARSANRAPGNGISLSRKSSPSDFRSSTCSEAPVNAAGQRTAGCGRSVQFLACSARPVCIGTVLAIAHLPLRAWSLLHTLTAASPAPIHRTEHKTN